MPKRLTAEDLASGRARVIRHAEPQRIPEAPAAAAPIPPELRETLSSIATGIGEVAGGQEALARALKDLPAPESSYLSGLTEALRRLGEIQEAARESLEALRAEVDRTGSREVVVKLDALPGPPAAADKNIERAVAAIEASVKAFAKIQAEGFAAMREVAGRVRELAEREIVVQAPPPSAAPARAEAAVELAVTERDAYGRIMKLKARRIDS